jgi:hypothetical protein
VQSSDRNMPAATVDEVTADLSNDPRRERDDEENDADASGAPGAAEKAPVTEKTQKSVSQEIDEAWDDKTEKKEAWDDKTEKKG